MSNFATRRNYSATPKNYFSVIKYVHPKFNKETVSFASGKKGEQICFDILGGYLVDLVKVEGEYEGRTTYNINIHLAQPDGAELDVISTSRYGGFVRDILLKLYPLESISYVELNPFLWEPKNEPSKKLIGCSVRHSKEYMPEIPESMKLKNNNKDFLPKIEIVKNAKGEDLIINGKQVFDTADRDKAIDDIIDLIKSKLLYTASSLRESSSINGATYLPADANVYEEVTDDGFDGEVPF